MCGTPSRRVNHSFISSIVGGFEYRFLPITSTSTSQKSMIKQKNRKSAEPAVTTTPAFQNPLSFNICSLASHNFSSILLSRTFATKVSPCLSRCPKGRKKPPLPSSIGLEIGSRWSAKKFPMASHAPQTHPIKLPSLTHHRSWRTPTSSWPHLPGKPCPVPSPSGRKT